MSQGVVSTLGSTVEALSLLDKARAPISVKLDALAVLRTTFTESEECRSAINDHIKAVVTNCVAPSLSNLTRDQLRLREQALHCIESWSSSASCPGITLAYEYLRTKAQIVFPTVGPVEAAAAAESQKFQETHAVAASVLSDADTAILECNTCFELLQAGAEVTVGDKAAVSTSAAGAGEEGDGEGKEEEAGWGEEDGEDGEGGEEWEEVELSASSFSAVAFLASLEKSAELATAARVGTLAASAAEGETASSSSSPPSLLPPPPHPGDADVRHCLRDTGRLLLRVHQPALSRLECTLLSYLRLSTLDSDTRSTLLDRVRACQSALASCLARAAGYGVKVEPRPVGVKRKEAAATVHNAWPCSFCGYENAPSRKHCEMCGNTKAIRKRGKTWDTCPCNRFACVLVEISPMDDVYSVDEAKLARLKESKPWMRDPRYFKRVRVSAVAAMKMTSHAKAGVEKGLASKTGLPIEIMGLMTGEIDTENENTLIVTDVAPIPVEGTETSVILDNTDLHNYMIAQSELFDETRGSHFNGWYHSHPFDVGVHSNCFLSQTDVSTQLGWQLSEDAHGNPWIAIVVDPLRSLAKGRPEIGAFRGYPPSFSLEKGYAPDGVIWEDEAARNARWGASCVSYYQLEVEYFMSTLSFSLLDILSREFLWTKVLASTPALDREIQDRVTKQVGAVTRKLDGVSGGSSSAAAIASGGPALPSLADAGHIASDVATEALRGDTTQLVKHLLFNRKLGCGCAHTK